MGPAVAIAVALNILREGSNLVWRSSQGLMDKRVEREVLDTIESTLGEFAHPARPVGPEDERHFAALPLRELDLTKHRRGRVRTATGAPAERRPPERLGAFDGPASPEKLRAVAGEGPVPLARLEERRAVVEVHAEPVLREQGAGLRLDLGRDVSRRPLPLLTEDPLQERRDR